MIQIRYLSIVNILVIDFVVIEKISAAPIPRVWYIKKSHVFVIDVTNTFTQIGICDRLSLDRRNNTKAIKFGF